MNLVALPSASYLIRKSVTNGSFLVSVLRFFADDVLDGSAELWPTSPDQRAWELLSPGADEAGHIGWMPFGHHFVEGSELQDGSTARSAAFIGVFWGPGRRLVHPLALVQSSWPWPSQGC